MATKRSIEPAYEPSNTQRTHLGLRPVERDWQARIVPGRYFPDLKVYHHAGRILKYIRFQETPSQLHFHEVDIDLVTTDEALTWSNPGRRGKPRKVVQSNLPRGNGASLIWNGYPNAGVALIEVVHVPTGEVVVASGEIEFAQAADIGRWLDAFIARSGDEHLRAARQPRGRGRPPPEPWLPGDFVAIEAAEGSWIFARLLVPVEYVADRGLLRGFTDGSKPAHPWIHVAAPCWWSQMLVLPTVDPSPSLEQLRAAPRLVGGLLVQPRDHDGRHRVVGHAPISPDELDLPESVQRWSIPGPETYGYDWGLIQLELAGGAWVERLPVHPSEVTAQSTPLYDLPGIEAQLRRDHRAPIEHPYGRHFVHAAPDRETRASVLRGLGLAVNLDYDELCARMGVVDRAGLADLLNAVPAPGLVPRPITRR